MDDNQTLCAKLSERERQLHRPETRNQHSVVDELLHEQFFEIGRSGRRYDRAQVVDALINDAPEDEIHAEDFAVTVLSEGCALLTYRSLPLMRKVIWQGQRCAHRYGSKRVKRGKCSFIRVRQRRVEQRV